VSDLSQPALSLMPIDGLSGDTPMGAVADAFAWPTPALACYPAPARALQPEVCEIEGLNGKTIAGRLMHFETDAGIVKLRLSTARTTITLRFDQFRRLRLLAPLAPLATAAQLPQAEALTRRAAQLLSARGVHGSRHRPADRRITGGDQRRHARTGR